MHHQQNRALLQTDCMRMNICPFLPYICIFWEYASQGMNNVGIFTVPICEQRRSPPFKDKCFSRLPNQVVFLLLKDVALVQAQYNVLYRNRILKKSDLCCVKKMMGMSFWTLSNQSLMADIIHPVCARVFHWWIQVSHVSQVHSEPLFWNAPISQNNFHSSSSWIVPLRIVFLYHGIPITVQS